MILSDETIVQLTDMSFHLKQLGSMLSWNNIKLMKYASQLGTPFTISLKDERAALMYNGEFVDFISFATHRFLQEKNVIRDAVYRKCGSTRT